jgi:hypothetical protein
MNSVEIRDRIDRALWTRNSYDAPSDLCYIIIDQRPVLFDLDIDRWTNEGGALCRQEHLRTTLENQFPKFPKPLTLRAGEQAIGDR